MNSQRPRFSTGDEDTVNALLTSYLAAEEDDEPWVAQDTKSERDRIWSEWTSFCSLTKSAGRHSQVQQHQGAGGIDPFRFWLDFARDPSNPSNQAPVQTFLHSYVEKSVKLRVVLGPEERVMTRTVNSAHSVIEVWRRLVAAADFKVLRLERRGLRRSGEHVAANWMFLKWEQEGDKREGPGYLMVRWILTKLAPKLSLEINTLYVKVEATSEDIINLLLTLYLRAEDIPASPVTRASFHAGVILASTLGLRPGVLENTTCGQYTLSIVRDPTDRNKSRFIATPRLTRNKRQEAKTVSSRYRKDRFIAYSAAMVPFPLLCLTSLVIARALQMDALDFNVSSVHEFFRRPALGEANCIDIPWKAEFLDKPLFPLTYQVFHEMWNRCVLVMGSRRAIRPYALRVGAGSRMNDSLTSALRNYVMGHTSAVFEADYQADRVKANLASLAYGPKSIGRDECLFSDLRNMSLRRDDGAPISVSNEKMAQFQARNDMKVFRSQLQATTDVREKNRLRSQMSSTIEACVRLQLEEDRWAYFKEADRLRLDGLEPAPPSDAGGPGPAKALLPFFQRSETPPDGGISERYIDTMIRYLTSSSSASGKPSSNCDLQTSKCFVCSSTLSNRSTLTRHFGGHLADGTFDRPLRCRPCQRTGTTVVIEGPTQWCIHLEHAHGKQNTPNLVGKAKSPSRVSCLICQKSMSSTDLLVTHMNRAEIPRLLGQRFSCHECSRLGQPDNKSFSIWEWFEHAQFVHDWMLPRVEPCSICAQLCTPGRGFQRHCSIKHSDSIGKILSPSTNEARFQVNDTRDLVKHEESLHSELSTSRRRKKWRRRNEIAANQTTSAPQKPPDIPIDPALEALNHPSRLSQEIVHDFESAEQPASSSETTSVHLNHARPGDQSGMAIDRSVQEKNPMSYECNISGSIDSGGFEYWVVLRLVKRRKKQNRWQYLTRWKGYTPKHDTWEPIENLVEDVPELLEDFERNSPKMLQWIKEKRKTSESNRVN